MRSKRLRSARRSWTKDRGLRKATLRKEKAEEEAELRKLEKDEAAAKKKADKKGKSSSKKHSKKKGRSGQAGLSKSMPALGDKDTMFGPSANRGGVPSEQNQIDRVRLERAARAALLEKQRLAAKMENKSRTWKFEYTGVPEPIAGGIWDDMAFQEGEHPEVGTKGYQQNMLTLDPLNPSDSLQQGSIRKDPPCPHFAQGQFGRRCWRPSSLVFIPIFASSRVQANYQRTVNVDDDLLEVEYAYEDLIEVPVEGATQGGERGIGSGWRRSDAPACHGG